MPQSWLSTSPSVVMIVRVFGAVTCDTALKELSKIQVNIPVIEINCLIIISFIYISFAVIPFSFTGYLFLYYEYLFSLHCPFCCRHTLAGFLLVLFLIE